MAAGAASEGSKALRARPAGRLREELLSAEAEEAEAEEASACCSSA
jgi:hypothetical protein